MVARLNDGDRIAGKLSENATLPLIFRKNQNRPYVNDEVWETVKKVWNSWRVMDAKMNTKSNYVYL